MAAAVTAAVAAIVRPTVPTLFHSLHFSSSRPLFVLLELGVAVIGRTNDNDDDDSAPEPDAKKAKQEESSSSLLPPTPDPAAAAAGVAAAVQVVNITYEQLKNDPILCELNPQKRLPFYYDPTTNLSLTESGGLVQYLLERYDPHYTLHPAPGSPTRADFGQLLHFGPATAYHIGVPILFPGPDLEEKKQQWHDIVALTLERSLTKYGGPYLLGTTFSAVDATLAYDLVTIAAAGTVGDQLLTAHPALQAYHATLQGRPAYQTTFAPEKKQEIVSK